MKHVISLFLCFTITIISLFASPSVNTQAATDEYVSLTNGQVITLRNAAPSGKWHMNVQHGSSSSQNGTQINVYPWDETDTEKYQVQAVSNGSFRLAPRCTPKKCVSVRRYQKPLAENQGIVLWSADDDSELKFKIVGDKVAIVFNKDTSLCISPASRQKAETTQQQLVVKNSIPLTQKCCGYYAMSSAIRYR